MDHITIWTGKIAREVVPDEIDLAPFIAEHFAKGGRTRKKLLQPARGGALGGLGAGGLTLLPWILHAIYDATPFLAGLLTSKSINSSLVIIKALRTSLTASKQPSRLADQKMTLDPALAQTDTARLLKQCTETMTRILQQAGLSADKSEETTYEVILVLLQDAQDAIAFLQQMREKK